MKIYIASRWNRQRSLRVVRNEFLRDLDIQVISSWIDAERPEDSELTEQFFMSVESMRRMNKDLEDIDRADVVVADILEGVGRRGGMLIEIGFALGRNKPVILIGRPATFGVFGHVFTRHFPDWHTAIHEFFASFKK